MLHAQFQDHRISGSEEDLRFLLYWTWRPSWSCDLNLFIYTFVPPSQGGSTLNLAFIDQAVSKKMF